MTNEEKKILQKLLATKKALIDFKEKYGRKYIELSPKKDNNKRPKK